MPGTGAGPAVPVARPGFGRAVAKAAVLARLVKRSARAVMVGEGHMVPVSRPGP